MNNASIPDLRVVVPRSASARRPAEGEDDVSDVHVNIAYIPEKVSNTHMGNAYGRSNWEIIGFAKIGKNDKIAPQAKAKTVGFKSHATNAPLPKNFHFRPYFASTSLQKPSQTRSSSKTILTVRLPI